MPLSYVMDLLIALLYLLMGISSLIAILIFLYLSCLRFIHMLSAVIASKAPWLAGVRIDSK
jgi:hypothetical protein